MSDDRNISGKKPIPFIDKETFEQLEGNLQELY